jgi:hypothetical protein
MRLATLLGPDDQYWGDSWANYWAATLFRPGIDPKVQERLLAIHDWLSLEEGQVFASLGIEGTYWKRAASGGYEITREKDNFGNFQPCHPLQLRV